MSDASLLKQIQQVGRRAQRLLWWYALLMAISASLLWALGTVLLDYVLRMEHPALRWFLSFGAITGLLGIGIRWLVPVLRLRLDEVRTARWIERGLPALQDRLSSAIQFLRDPPHDPTAGSTDLRSALVRQTVAQLSEIDVQQVLDRQGVRRAAWIGIATLLLVLTLALSHPVDLGVGLARLGFPWKSLRWPTAHALSFASLPTRVAQGSRICVQVVDTRGELPVRVELWYWPQGSRSTEIVRYDMHRNGDTAEWTLPKRDSAFSTVRRGRRRFGHGLGRRQCGRGTGTRGRDAVCRVARVHRLAGGECRGPFSGAPRKSRLAGGSGKPSAAGSQPGVA